jgi:hypothetical protein
LERFVAVGALALTALVVSAGAAHAAPPACNNSPQITDDSGDGHHASSDVVAAWFTEAGGKLQAVIQVRAATFLPEHGDADVNGSGFALLTYDYGTYAPGAFFTTLGATTGSVERGPGTGATTIDIPAALGATPGTLLGAPFALTYDGISGGVPAWVDHAPGAEDPGDPARGADYVVGACGSGGGGPGGVAVRTLAVTISAPSKLTGGGRAIVSGNVTPARAGVEVSVTRSAHATRVTKVRTEADGSYALLVPVNESTRVQAVAEGIHSGTRTIGVRSRTRLRVRHAHSGAAYLSGTVAPALPGRALLLRPDSPAVLARAAVTRGRFAFHRRLRGAYQVVYVPSGERAERSSSNTARIR